MTSFNTYKNLHNDVSIKSLEELPQGDDSIKYLQGPSKWGGSIEYFEELPQQDDALKYSQELPQWYDSLK